MQSIKILLDTHVLLWSIGETGALSERVKQEIKNPDNSISVSAISLWEIALKSSLGKLTVNFNLRNIPEYCKKMGFDLVPLSPIDALESLQLPQKKNYKDPFDRMLVYQCIKNDFTLVSRDKRIVQYKTDGLKLIW